MPVLEIIDGNGQRVRGAASNVIAAMVFPKDRKDTSGHTISAAALRRNLGVASAAVAIREWEDLAERFPDIDGVFKVLSRLARQRFEENGGVRAVADINATNFLWDAMRLEALRGQAAGEALLFMLAHNAAHSGQASVRTTRHVIARLGGKSDAWAKLVWAQFRGVAHLWGAYRLCGEKSLLTAIDGDQLEPFLANAEILRMEADRLPRHGYHNPLQSRDETWTAPSIRLPAPTVAIPAWTARHEQMLRQARQHLARQDLQRSKKDNAGR